MPKMAAIDCVEPLEAGPYKILMRQVIMRILENPTIGTGERLQVSRGL